MGRLIASEKKGVAPKDRSASFNLSRSTLEHLLIKDVNVHSCDGGGAGTAALREVFFDLSSKIKPTVFCEIGAHDGATAAQFKSIHPHCRVYSFEANPEIHSMFLDRHRDTGVDYRNLAIDNKSGSVKLFAPATASKRCVRGSGIVDTAFADRNTTGWTSLLVRDEAATYSELEVESSTLDGFLKGARCNISKENIVLWIRGEGAAHRVLKGARRALARTSIVCVEMETYGFWKGQRDARHVASVLMKRGLVPVARDREYDDAQFTVLFVSADYLEHVERELFDPGSPLQSCIDPASGPENPATTTVSGGAGPAPSDGIVRIKYSAPSAVSEFLQRDIPVFIPAFNNPTYVRKMVGQLRSRNLENLIVVDSGSTLPAMLALLETDFGATVVRLGYNAGPRHIISHQPSFRLLPELFCITDPDLELNPELPIDFIARLVDLTERFEVGKAGFSLDISDPSAMRDESFNMGGTPYKIWEWEQKFWVNQIAELDGSSPVYRANLDTTFAVYNKKYFRPERLREAIRVAGVFTCRHLPWYRDERLPVEEARAYRDSRRNGFYSPQVLE